MTDDIDLGEYEAPAIEPEQLIAEARLAAKSPKPTIDDMIQVAFGTSCDIESSQTFLLLTGDRTAPFGPKMRDAAVLTAIGDFLSLIKTKQKAVAEALRGRS